MRRSLFLLYGLLSYLLFLVVYTATACFFGNVGLPQTIDGPVRSNLGPALAIDAALVLMLGLQHSVMA